MHFAVISSIRLALQRYSDGMRVERFRGVYGVELLGATVRVGRDHVERRMRSERK